MTAIDVTAPTAWVTVALGILAPIIAAIINRPTWTAPVRRRMAIVVSVVLAVVAFVVTGKLDQFDVKDLVAVILAVIGLSQFTYALIWKPTGVTTAVENATSPMVVDALHGSSGQQPVIREPEGG